jgi:hypothetical protein
MTVGDLVDADPPQSGKPVDEVDHLTWLRGPTADSSMRWGRSGAPRSPTSLPVPVNQTTARAALARPRPSLCFPQAMALMAIPVAEKAKPRRIKIASCEEKTAINA